MKDNTDYKTFSKNLLENHIREVGTDIVRLEKRINDLKEEVVRLEKDLALLNLGIDSMNKIMEIIERS